MNKFPSDFFLPPRYVGNRMSSPPVRPSAPSCEIYASPKPTIYASPKPTTKLPTLRPVIHSPPKYFMRRQTRSFDNSNKQTPGSRGSQLHKRLRYKYEQFKHLNFF